MFASARFTPNRKWETPHNVPLIVLLIVALAAAALSSLAVLRYPHARPAVPDTVVEAVEEVASHSAGMRSWLRARRDPKAATGLALSVALGATVIGGLILASLAYLIRGNDALLDTDSGVARWGHDHASHWSTLGLRAITQLGDTPAVAVLLLVLALVEIRRIRTLHVMLFLAAVIIGNHVVTTAIKDLADRARPTLNAFAATLGPSFPSGHSSTAASFYAAAALVLGRRRGRRARALLAGGAVGIAVAVASSRVLLDDHWLSDVIAGLALGWAWFSLCAIAFGGRLLQFGATVERAESDLPPRRASARPEV
jgi:membrane-associated phospholipid phosphatase